jgi:hypothetical protein
MPTCNVSGMIKLTVTRFDVQGGYQWEVSVAAGRSDPARVLLVGSEDIRMEWKADMTLTPIPPEIMATAADDEPTAELIRRMIERAIAQAVLRAWKDMYKADTGLCMADLALPGGET